MSWKKQKLIVTDLKQEFLDSCKVFSLSQSIIQPFVQTDLILTKHLNSNYFKIITNIVQKEMKISDCKLKWKI